MKLLDSGRRKLRVGGINVRDRASGKLYNKYTRKLRKVKPGVVQYKKDEALEREAKILDECDGYLSELSETSLDDFNKITLFWERTYKIREPLGDIVNYYERFPQLHPPLGSQLVCSKSRPQHLF